MDDPKSSVFIIVGLIPAMILGLVFSIMLLGGDTADSCAVGDQQSGVAIDPNSVPDTMIAGYGHEQLVNAAWIMHAGHALNLSVRDQTIAVMTAMGESSLRVIDYGDAAGPDSRGLFQQRDNGAWGTHEDRMDPYTSATNFFRALMTLQDRADLEPTVVAHRVQRNADPYHYTRFWNAAVEVTGALSGIQGTAKGVTATSAGCATSPMSPAGVNAYGWTTPGTGPITSPYGMRVHPINQVSSLHSGTDLQAGGCDGPIWAAHDGIVTFSGFDSVGNGAITLDHGERIETSYLHMYGPGILVRVGDVVKAGQQIARTGSSGLSTGCHLHFQVKVKGSLIDPQPFMAQVGVTLGQ